MSDRQVLAKIYWERLVGQETGTVKFSSMVATRANFVQTSSTMQKLIGLTFALILLTMNANAADKLQHVVSFKFKSSATPEDIKKIEDGFRALKEKIPQMVSLEWGTNISKEKHDKGFTHCFIVTFKNEHDRDAYIAHPDHKAFGRALGPILEDVFVIDFWAKD